MKNKRRRKYKINKLRFFTVMSVMLILIVLSVISVYGAVNGMDALHSNELCTEYQLVEVAEGDSLWSIARVYCDTGSDVRKTVDAICYINSIDNYLIYPGQELLLPSC